MKMHGGMRRIRGHLGSALAEDEATYSLNLKGTIYRRR